LSPQTNAISERFLKTIEPLQPDFDVWIKQYSEPHPEGPMGLRKTPMQDIHWQYTVG
jgi:hypothetical protein